MDKHADWRSTILPKWESTMPFQLDEFIDTLTSLLKAIEDLPQSYKLLPINIGKEKKIIFIGKLEGEDPTPMGSHMWKGNTISGLVVQNRFG